MSQKLQLNLKRLNLESLVKLRKRREIQPIGLPLLIPLWLHQDIDAEIINYKPRKANAYTLSHAYQALGAITYAVQYYKIKVN